MFLIYIWLRGEIMVDDLETCYLKKRLTVVLSCKTKNKKPEKTPNKKQTSSMSTLSSSPLLPALPFLLLFSLLRLLLTYLGKTLSTHLSHHYIHSREWVSKNREKVRKLLRRFWKNVPKRRGDVKTGRHERRAVERERGLHCGRQIFFIIDSDP